ncbi:MAG: 4Fe-4S binding protein [Kiritimatiellia bacterium]
MKNPYNLYTKIRISIAAVSLLLTVLAFFGYGVAALYAHLQFGPALLRGLAGGGLLVVLDILLGTFLAGRFYCAVVCPLGILQDLAGWLSRRKMAQAPNLPWLRYATASIVYGFLTCGWAIGFLALDPYSLTGRAFRFVFYAGLVPVAIVLVAAVWKKRLFCTTVCPVGTLLGLVAKKGLFRLGISADCVSCGRCARQCPTGCIDLSKKRIDDERCIRCLDCAGVCPRHCIRLGRRGTSVERKPEEENIDASRRRFLQQGGVLLAGLAAGFGIGRFCRADGVAARMHGSILPPGAGDEALLASRCTACQLCVANCPSGIIVSSGGPVSIDLSRGACEYDCTQCGHVCPAGALTPLTLAQKRRTKIAEVSFRPQSCIVFQNMVSCGKCAAACPTGAITLRKSGAPRVHANLCIGCGACQKVCPAVPKAMTVQSIEKQVLLETDGDR